MPDPVLAYIAPEIPGFSSTFVYKEIYILEDLGLKVEPFSIHAPMATTGDSRQEALARRTTRVYGQGKAKLFRSHLHFCFRNPLRYWRLATTVVTDAISVLPDLKTAIGLCYRGVIAPCLARELSRRKVDHCHVHFAHVSTDVAMYSSLLSGIPFSVTAHANDLFQRGYLLPRKARRAAFISTISRFNIGWLQDKGIPADKLRLVRCGVDSREFSARQYRRQHEVFRFGFLARLVEKKGLNILLDACLLLKQRGIKFKLEVAGDGPLWDKLQSQVSTLGLQAEVSFLGAIANTEVRAWLEQIDCFVLPCCRDSAGDMDGIPVALMEAMLTGIPVISTSVSGIPELVIDGETGQVADPTPDSMAKCMHSLIGVEPEELVARVARAQKLVAGEFDIHRNTLHLLEEIKQCLADKASGNTARAGLKAT
ncbi:glycosyltransferase family 4 protein [Microbulbifer sp. YPW16]|uniref:glycosyltransferase family 4 protein n=1 Tax=Microbulbifer sp. YPW16 TaxID=2904242 RepID=UPI001E3D98EF|nr:glycosyltransferase family 4 protein [Microbulbifer sp. YPW16]UHQ54108.1 glycosyltransferase [Microbulbifer sp. YPW16]